MTLDLSGFGVRSCVGLCASLSLRRALRSAAPGASSETVKRRESEGMAVAYRGAPE